MALMHLKKFTRLQALCILVMYAFSAAPAYAADIEVDAELILAVDVSRSMSPRELEIQRRGYAEAIVSNEVISAIQNGLLGRVAITYVEWAGSFAQRVVVDWSLISNREEAQAFANKVTAHFEDSLRRTSISGALLYSSTLFQRNGFTSNRQIIDISGDGPNNQGLPVLPARDRVLSKGIVINGLPLMTQEGLGSFLSIDDLDDYYFNCVTGGPASFVLPVLNWEQFPDAVRKKLVLELARNPDFPIIKAQFSDGRNPNYDCLIGEKLWEFYFGREFLP